MSLVELISQYALVTTTTPTLVHDGCEEERCRTEAGGVLTRASCGGRLHCYPTVADMFVKNSTRLVKGSDLEASWRRTRGMFVQVHQ